jgi:hypothetical protein
VSGERFKAAMGYTTGSASKVVPWIIGIWSAITLFRSATLSFSDPRPFGAFFEQFIAFFIVDWTIIGGLVLGVSAGVWASAEWRWHFAIALLVGVAFFMICMEVRYQSRLLPGVGWRVEAALERINDSEDYDGYRR